MFMTACEHNTQTKHLLSTHLPAATIFKHCGSLGSHNISGKSLFISWLQWCTAMLLYCIFFSFNPSCLRYLSFSYNLGIESKREDRWMAGEWMTRRKKLQRCHRVQITNTILNNFKTSKNYTVNWMEDFAWMFFH